MIGKIQEISSWKIIKGREVQVVKMVVEKDQKVLHDCLNTQVFCVIHAAILFLEKYILRSWIVAKLLYSYFQRKWNNVSRNTRSKNAKFLLLAPVIRFLCPWYRNVKLYFRLLLSVLVKRKPTNINSVEIFCIYFSFKQTTVHLRKDINKDQQEALEK